MRAHRIRWKTSSGFSLLEALVATTVLTVGVVALAQLFIVAASANRGSRTTTLAVMLAQQKMEQLRGLTWGFDVLGLPVADTATNTAVDPPQPGGGTGLTPSPSGALARNTPGYCDFVDRSGHLVGDGTAGDGALLPPDGAAYVRRWAVEPLPANPANTIVLQVLVALAATAPGGSSETGARRLPDEVRLLSVRTRKAG